MTLIWGILGVVSAVFFPGWMCVRLFNITVPLGLRWALIFSLSLALNQILVLVLAGLHIYTPFIMRTLIGIQIFFSLYLSRHSCFKKITLQYSLPRPSPLVIFMVILIFIQLIYIGLAFKQIFVNSDAVLSWNKWASDWAHNQHPIHSENYPQLLPIIFSIPYILMNYQVDLQFFAKPISEAFILSMIFAGLGLAEIKHSPIIRWGILFSGIGLIVNYSYYLGNGSGYADIPSACLAFTAWLCVLGAVDRDHIDYKLLAFSSIIAGAAAATKQAGIFYAAVHPLLFYYVARSHQHKPSIKTLLMQYVWIGLIFLPYTVYNQYQILIQHMPTETGRLAYAKSLAAQGRTGFALFFHILFSVKWIWLCAFGLSVVAAFYDSEALIILPFTLIYFVIWFDAFNYDTRNLALVTPFIFFYATKWVASFACFPSHTLKNHRTSYKISVRPVTLILVAFFIAITAGNSVLTAQKMLDHQISLQKRLTGKKPELDQMLYTYFGDPPRAVMILTNWYFLPLLPEFNNAYQAINLSTPDTLIQGLKGQAGHYLLITLDSDFHPPAGTMQSINALASEKRLILVKQVGHQYLYLIQPVPSP